MWSHSLHENRWWSILCRGGTGMLASRGHSLSREEQFQRNNVHPATMCMLRGRERERKQSYHERIYLNKNKQKWKHFKSKQCYKVIKASDWNNFCNNFFGFLEETTETFDWHFLMNISPPLAFVTRSFSYSPFFFTRLQLFFYLFFPTVHKWFQSIRYSRNIPQYL